MASKIKDKNMVVTTDDGEMKICIMDISPKQAGELLSRNVNNRNLRPNRVNLYTSEMMSNNWKANGVPIIVGSDGELKDGQHRLTACMKSGKTLKNTLVVYLPKSQANCYDIGAPRNAKDVAKFLGLDEEPMFRSLSMFCAVHFAIDGKDSGYSYSKIHLINEMQKHSDACEFIYHKLYNLSYAQKNKLRRSAIAAAIFNAYLCGYNIEKLERFCKVLGHGIVQDESEIPIITLRDIIFNSSQLKTKEDRTRLYFKTQAALYAYENNKEINIAKNATEYYSYPDSNKKKELRKG